ncbi:MAG: hypothetical protein IKU83_02735 [Lachnospiraceae bacterium]|nr:hypothetical protein [Lachnospiraceae bacterium]
MRLKNFVIVVDDMEQSMKFYSDLFGLVKVREFEGNIILSDGLVLQERKSWEHAIKQEVSYQGHSCILYFETPSLIKFLEKVWASAWAVNLVHPMGEDGSDRHLVRLYDPDGHVIEVSECITTMPETIEEDDEDYDWAFEEETEEEPPTELNIGDVFKFGRYWYAADLVFGKQEIEWRVLDKKDGKLLVLSSWALDARGYHDGPEAVAWEDCELRAWLNGSFMDSAFRWDERRLIAWRDGIDSDRVFLLSEEELEEYWLVMDSNANTSWRWGANTMATPYAVARGAVGDERDELQYETQTWWWLRDAFGAVDAAPYVDETGQNAGARSNTTIGAVRPAMWVKEEVIEKATDIIPFVEDEYDEWEEDQDDL